ncbi:4-hydroxy-3-methylbut-2-en-1-yl diphosphate synthase [candidate division LCP-89 bacterium B3_LCP]|uniref:4-hydroxy-3-methylbut-2-en-1-yl diphosphate synthase (flavodoxin) n=1 Tax=candidate division LCP-89 bacterium B3_LCP TaxID=2012998 RepID=A0A532V1D5_UNCL8|nr:MAG: 4-hydroxy-3-methylbut-2-en-1-yl diphosphate synthase [candidate division LCP-89 bacterium B3_LCP]
MPQMIQRRVTKRITVRGLGLGGDEPVRVQSMTSTHTTDIRATIDQIKQMEAVGCELVRLAVPDNLAVEAFAEIRQQTDLPLIADIHFDYRLALAVMDAGADKIRFNPGNIGGPDRALIIAKQAAQHGIPLRIGVNSGSVEDALLEKYGGPTPEALVESALRHIELLSTVHDIQLVLSLKASDVFTAVMAYRSISEKTDWPLHVGITEAGTPFSGAIRSAVGIGTLLAEGIGDTLRVSLTGSVIEEIRVAWEILRCLGLRQRGVTLISCPTCGRTDVDLIPIALQVEEKLKSIREPIKVAVMGCAVNGPGEAREADVGVACGKEEGLIFRGGEIVRKVPEASIVKELLSEIERFRRELQAAAG